MSAEKEDKYILDSFAVLTYFKEEPGWQKVKALLWQAYNDKKRQIFINCVNLGEIYYIIYREHGAVTADQSIAMIKTWPVNFVAAEESLAIIAGRTKAENKISYADAFVVATALDRQAKILTGDREFKEVEDIVAIDWLPKNR